MVREARVENPLVPLRLFTLRNVVVSQVVGVLWAGAMFACFFLLALYLQGVLGYDALQVGLAYLPSCAVMAVMSLRVSDKLVMKYGVRPPLVVGLALVAASLALFAHGAGRRHVRRARAARRWCCSAWAPASPSTRCCWPRWATSSPTRPDWPRAWSTPRS